MLDRLKDAGCRAGGAFAWALAVACASPLASGAVTYTPIATLDGTHGANPQTHLAVDAAGNVYGTTTTGGVNNSGVVFMVAAGTHQYSVLADLPANNTVNGPSIDSSGLTADSAGNLYGTTYYGGTNQWGTLYRIDGVTHSMSTVLAFDGFTGANPMGIALDGAGNIYGTTAFGGDASHGNVFKLAAGDSAATSLGYFTTAGGWLPAGGIVTDAAGNYYGATFYGGPTNNGTVFRLNPVTHVVTSLVSFDGTNGGGPRSGLVSDAAGNFYGFTPAGGTNNAGVVYKLSGPAHTFSVLANFHGGDGSGPEGLPLIDAAGNIFGVTSGGGALGAGSVFEIPAATGQLTTLYSLSAATGSMPLGDLTADANGNLYGTTFYSASGGPGTVFEVSGAGFVVPEPASLALAAALVLLVRPRYTSRGGGARRSVSPA